MIYLMASSEPELGIYYFEVDPEGVAYRQVVIEEDGSWVTSHRKHAHYHFMLAERPIDLNDDYYERISKDKFEDVWSRSLQTTMEEWNRMKEAMPIGTKVAGKIEAFFPQGTLVELAQEQAIGLANTAHLSAGSAQEWMYPGYRLEAVVKGYDEQNQWVLLEQARMLNGER